VEFDEQGRRKYTCALLDEEIEVRNSTNGRAADGSLVLRFSAVVTLDREVFSFRNKHVQIVGPMRQNVTDSYTQIRDIFDISEECDPDDLECIRGQENLNGN
jgi:hypothetical protein